MSPIRRSQHAAASAGIRALGPHPPLSPIILTVYLINLIQSIMGTARPAVVRAGQHQNVQGGPMGYSKDRNRAFHGLAGALAGIIAISAIPAVHAADAEASDTQLVEIVVTAQRRSENLQNVPLSAQVISNAQLIEQNYNDLQDLSQIIPSLHVSAGGATSDIYIRGIGSGNSQSFDQSVGTFVDDVYFGRARSSTATFFDVNRIEVLKGPQSTFFGNNAIAGALNISTNKPGDTFDASARALYGMFGQYAIEA